MYEKFGASHSLNGLPGAVVFLQRALDNNRHRIAKQFGVSGSELRALARVAEAGSVTPKELAESLGMTTGAVTAISTRLVAAGLMCRVDHPNDRRSIFLKLTPPADEVLEQIYGEFAAALAVATKDVPEAELRRCCALLYSVAEQFIPLNSSILAEPVVPVSENRISHPS